MTDRERYEAAMAENHEIRQTAESWKIAFYKELELNKKLVDLITTKLTTDTTTKKA